MPPTLKKIHTLQVRSLLQAFSILEFQLCPKVANRILKVPGSLNYGNVDNKQRIAYVGDQERRDAGIHDRLHDVASGNPYTGNSNDVNQP